MSFVAIFIHTYIDQGTAYNQRTQRISHQCTPVDEVPRTDIVDTVDGIHIAGRKPGSPCTAETSSGCVQFADCITASQSISFTTIRGEITIVFAACGEDPLRRWDAINTGRAAPSAVDSSFVAVSFAIMTGWTRVTGPTAVDPCLITVSFSIMAEL